VQRQQLLAKGQIFEDEIRAGTESTDNPAEEMPEGHDHGHDLIETRRVKLVSKSFILRVHEVLTRDTRKSRSVVGSPLRQFGLEASPCAAIFLLVGGVR